MMPFWVDANQPTPHWLIGPIRHCHLRRFPWVSYPHPYPTHCRRSKLPIWQSLALAFHAGYILQSSSSNGAASVTALLDKMNASRNADVALFKMNALRNGHSNFNNGVSSGLGGLSRLSNHYIYIQSSLNSSASVTVSVDKMNLCNGHSGGVSDLGQVECQYGECPTE